MQQKLLPQLFFLSRNMSVDGTYFKMMHQISLVNLVTLTAIVHPEEFIEPRRAQKLCYITTSASQHRQTARIKLSMTSFP